MTTKSDTAAANASVTEALINVQAHLDPLRANATSHHGKFANLQGVMELLKPHLERNHLAIIQRPVASASGSCTLETILRHAQTGEEITSTITIPTQRQNDPQAYGAAMTYGRRYSLLCLFGMVTEDDNGDSSSYTLEKLLRELSAATSLDELQAIKNRHFDNNLLADRFWNGVYKILHDKKYATLSAISQVSE
ncbi:ERF family protein [Rhizobium sp. Nf11,1]|uniref:ERF family protein n=1 Tax=Rhizobium sp. Nf11,1 TaxID=3404923 RepID=UPI003D33A040